MSRVKECIIDACCLGIKIYDYYIYIYIYIYGAQQFGDAPQPASRRRKKD